MRARRKFGREEVKRFCSWKEVGKKTMRKLIVENQSLIFKKKDVTLSREYQQFAKEYCVTWQKNATQLKCEELRLLSTMRNGKEVKREQNIKWIEEKKKKMRGR